MATYRVFNNMRGYTMHSLSIIAVSHGHVPFAPRRGRASSLALTKLTSASGRHAVAQ